MATEQLIDRLDEYTFLPGTGSDEGHYSPTQSRALVSALQNYLPDGMAPKSTQLTQYLYHRIVEPLEGDSLRFFTVRELIETQDTVVQTPINPSKVYEVINGEFGILKGYSLLKPIVLGDKGEDGFVNMGGRHRLSAIISLFRMFGVSDSTILEIELPCTVLKYNHLFIIADNKSRSATKYEVAGVKVSADGIDIHDPQSLWTSYTSGKLNHLGTETTRRGIVLRLLFVLMTATDNAGLTEEARGAIAAALPSQFGKKFPQQKYALKDNDFLISLMDYASQQLGSIVTGFRQAGVSNISRSTTDIAGSIITKLMKDKSIPLPAKPTKAVKTVKEAKEVQEEKPAAKAKAKKQTTTAKKNGRGTTKQLENLPESVEELVEV